MYLFSKFQELLHWPIQHLSFRFTRHKHANLFSCQNPLAHRIWTVNNENKWQNIIIKNKSGYKEQTEVTQWQTNFSNKFYNTFIK